MKFPDGTFSLNLCFMEDVYKHDEKIFFLFLKLGVVSKNSIPANFTYIRHFKKRVGIIATTFEESRIHFNSDVFAAVAVVVVVVALYI